MVSIFLFTSPPPSLSHTHKTRNLMSFSSLKICGKTEGCQINTSGSYCPLTTSCLYFSQGKHFITEILAYVSELEHQNKNAIFKVINVN